MSNLQRQAYVFAGFDLMMLALAACFTWQLNACVAPKNVLQ